LQNFCSKKQETRDQPKFGFGYGAETGDIFSLCYGRSREAVSAYFWLEPNDEKVSTKTETVLYRFTSSTAAVLLMIALSKSERLLTRAV